MKPWFTFALAVLIATSALADPACPDADVTDLKPIVEHPSGDFATAPSAIAEAFQRIELCGETKRWVILSGQGQGWRLDSYKISDVRYRDGEFVFPEPISNVTDIAREVGMDMSTASTNEDHLRFKIVGATAEQLAAFLDRVYTQHLGIKPHDGESDYAFGAEWD